MLNHFISGRCQPKPIFGICRTSNKSMAAILSLSSCSIRSRTSPGSVQPYLHLKIIIIGLTFQFISIVAVVSPHSNPDIQVLPPSAQQNGQLPPFNPYAWGYPPPPWAWPNYPPPPPQNANAPVVRIKTPPEPAKQPETLSKTPIKNATDDVIGKSPQKYIYLVGF